MPIPEGYSEHDWELLTDEEKEGVMEGIEDDAAAVATPDDNSITDPELQKIIADLEKEEADKTNPPIEKKESDTTHETDKDGSEEPPPETDVKPEGDDATPETPPPPTDIDDDTLLKFRPSVSRDEVAKSTTVPPDLAAKMYDIKSRYENDDITIDAYVDEMSDVKAEITRHQLAEEASAREAVEWSKAQRYFFEARNDYVEMEQVDGKPKYDGGKPVFTRKAKVLYGALTKVVDDLSSQYSGMELLVRADKEVRDILGLGKKEIPPVEKPKPKSIDKPPAGIPDIKTLTDTPAAADTSTNSQWAQLDKLSGPVYEAALEKLPANVRDAYLNSQG